jgi:hypothetical protein
MDTRKLGVLEIFFGPPWTNEERRSWADFLGREQMGFYLYGPKADSRLRKNWLDPWPENYLAELTSMAKVFQSKGVRFAVALSPFGLRNSIDLAAKRAVQAKCLQLRAIGIDFLGLFFDDMPSTDGLADMQLEVLAVAREAVGVPVVFCPSYYSTDPILDKVFGARPADYLARIGKEIPADVEILWTGPQVISSEIGAGHLRETAAVLGRQPFLCDNLFANDGPKNCKFLKLRPAEGRTPEALTESSFWSLNLMNQAVISQLLAYSAKLVFSEACSAESSLERAIRERLSPGCAAALLRDRDLFLNLGLDKVEAPLKEKLCKEYAGFPDAAAQEVVRWLQDHYLVGKECLTD